VVGPSTVKGQVRESMQEGFGGYLRRGGRSENAADRVISNVGQFEQYLREHRGQQLDEATGEDLEAYVDWFERGTGKSAKGQLWAIRYYAQFCQDDDLAHLAGLLRQKRIKRKAFPLKGFRGVAEDVTGRVAAAGIRNVQQMLTAGATPGGRAALSERTGVPAETILELVKLSDLARIPGVKGIRARLYHDAGVDTVEKMAQWEPEALREAMKAFVKNTGFEGIAPLPAEARFTVAEARRLPKIVAWESKAK
jgi:hypothetical protein